MENWVAGIAHYIIRTSEICNLHMNQYILFLNMKTKSTVGGWERGYAPSPCLLSQEGGQERGCSHPGPSATSTASVGGAIHLTAPPCPGSHYSVRGSENFSPHLLAT